MPSEEVLRKTVDALANVGASYDAMKELDSRLGKELEEWVQNNPEVRSMLREAKSSGKPVKELLKQLKEYLDEDEGGENENLE